MRSIIIVYETQEKGGSLTHKTAHNKISILTGKNHLVSELDWASNDSIYTQQSLSGGAVALGSIRPC